MVETKEKKHVVKKRYWGTVLYPESCKENWKENLEKSGLKCCVSPLHDLDLDDNGELKKSHYHILCCYNGPVTRDNFMSVVNSIGAVGAEKIENVKGYFDYLIHKNNLDKHQYNIDDLQMINGFNILDYCDRTTVESIELKMKLIKYCDDNKIICYRNLIKKLISDNNFDLFDCASCNPYFIIQYLK